MSKNHNSTLDLPADLAAFAQMQVDNGHYGSVIEVVREAFGLLQDRASKVVALRKELDQGIAQLDADEGIRTTPRELMDAIRADIGLTRSS